MLRRDVNPGGPARAGTTAVWCLLALAVRLGAVLALHDRAYLMDHLSYVFWGQLAVSRGLSAMYMAPAEWARPENTPYRVYTGANRFADRQLLPQPPIPLADRPQTVNWTSDDGLTLTLEFPSGSGTLAYAIYRPLPFGYPPVAAVLYAALGHLHRWFDPTQTPDTRLAHVLFAAPAILCDVLLALLVAAALRARGGVFSPRAGLLLTLFAPALIWDSSVWLQTDSIGAVFIVGALLCVLHKRLPLASMLCGVGLLVKPQVVLTLPVLALAAVEGASWRRTAVAALAGLATIIAGAWPFLLSGGLRWFEVAYVANGSLLAGLTLSAANPWWIVSLFRGALLEASTWPAHPSPDAWKSPLLSDRLPWIMGLTPRAVGLVLFVSAAVLAWVVVRRPLRNGAAVCVFAYLFYLAAFIFPTEVHERYIIYALPLSLLAAAELRSVRASCWVLQVVCLINVAGYMFLELPVEQTGFGAADWGKVVVLGAAAAVTPLLFILPLVELWYRPREPLTAQGSPNVAAPHWPVPTAGAQRRRWLRS